MVPKPFEDCQPRSVASLRARRARIRAVAIMVASDGLVAIKVAIVSRSHHERR